MQPESLRQEAVEPDIRLIAFFLTQFHPIPENDEWWGRGFTEWTNVTKARPVFPGHHQPQLPTELGFYDLRLRETRREQIALAKAYGIFGFCYHYYWFSGRRVLEKPLNDMLADTESDMPFCLCWANENWTRRWDAAEHEVLLAQKYLPDDDENFIKDLIPVFRDPRYICHDGAPVLIVYRPQHLPNPAKTLRIWREYCASVGIPKLHLCAALTHGNWEFKHFGFDAGVEFPPHNIKPLKSKMKEAHAKIAFYEKFDGTVAEFQDVASLYLENHYSKDRPVFRTVFPAWDNTARRGKNSVIILNGTPRNYEYWLKEAVARSAEEFPGEDRFVFINAWNEWAEGCHLEPDRQYGRQFLEATQRVKQGHSQATGFADVGLPDSSLHPFARRNEFILVRICSRSVHAVLTLANDIRRIFVRLGRSIKKRINRMSSGKEHAHERPVRVKG